MGCRAAVPLVFMATFVACATIPANAPPYTRAPDPGAGMANVYVYRSGLEAWCQKLGAPALFVDGRAIYDLVPGAYTVVPLDAGTHKLKLSSGTGACPDLEFYLHVDAGQSQYVKFSGSYGSESVPVGNGSTRAAWVGRAWAAPVPEPIAERELTQCCRFLAADKLPANASPQDRLITGR
jgi:hypothetical protein